MKIIFEHMTTELMLIVMLFVFSVFSIIDAQVLAARRIHASVVDQMQASYYSVDIDAYNEALQEKYPDWKITVTELDTYETRKEYIVELEYEVIVPMFNITKNQTISGYVR